MLLFSLVFFASFLKVLHPKLLLRLCGPVLTFLSLGAAHVDSGFSGQALASPNSTAGRAALLSPASPLRVGLALLRRLLEPAPNAAAFPVSGPGFPAGARAKTSDKADSVQAARFLSCAYLCRLHWLASSEFQCPQMTRLKSCRPRAPWREGGSSPAWRRGLQPCQLPQGVVPGGCSAQQRRQVVSFAAMSTCTGHLPFRGLHCVPHGTSQLPNKWLRNWKMFFVCSFACFLATFSPNLVILRERRQRKWSAAFY